MNAKETYNYLERKVIKSYVNHEEIKALLLEYEEICCMEHEISMKTNTNRSLKECEIFEHFIAKCLHFGAIAAMEEIAWSSSSDFSHDIYSFFQENLETEIYNFRRISKRPLSYY